MQKRSFFILLVGALSIAVPCYAAAVPEDAASLDEMVREDFFHTTQVFRDNFDTMTWLTTYNYFAIQHEHQDVSLKILQSDEYTDLVLHTSGLVRSIYGHFLCIYLNHLEASDRLALVLSLALVLGSIVEELESVDLREKNVRAQYRALVQSARSLPRDTPRRTLLKLLVDRIAKHMAAGNSGGGSWGCAFQ